MLNINKKVYDFDEILLMIDDYWDYSDKIKNMIDNLNFTDIKTEGIGIRDVENMVKYKLSLRYHASIYYEKLSLKEMYNNIIKNTFDFRSDNFCNFIIKLLYDKFTNNMARYLHKYVLYLKFISHKKVKKEQKKTTIFDKFKLNKNDFNIFDIKKVIEILEQVEKTTYKQFVKKYHPDINKIDDEYIQIVNQLRDLNIIK